jgi:hypothetical protein
MKTVSESYCFSCECLLLVDSEKLGPICRNCFRKTKRRDPLMKAAIKSAAVVVVPMVCPHEEQKHGNCRFKEPRYFSVIVLDKNLDPKQITAPFTARAAEREAKRIRRSLSKRGGR